MQNKTHIPLVLTFTTFILSILFLISIVFILSIGSLISLIQQTTDAASQMIAAFSFGFVSLILILCAWFVLEKIRNKEKADNTFSLPFFYWQIALAFAIVIIAIGIGIAVSLLENQILSWLILPTMTILVIVPPIWLIFGLGSHGLPLGSRWRFFSIFGLGLTLGPLMMIMLEIIILIFGIIIGVFYIAIAQPQFVEEFRLIADQLSNVTDQQIIFNVLAPYITNPKLIGAVLLYIAVIVPFIEEFFKPLGVWLFAKQIDSPAQGFVLGLLSGAAFALFESLNASADGSTSWGAIVTARAGTSLLHMTASGLMGWGIVSAFQEKKYSRFIGAYLSAVLIHGMWNAAAAGAGISAIGESVGKPEWLFNYAPALICGLLVLAIGMFAVLIASNKKLREQK